jgi:hypothetical protein
MIRTDRNAENVFRFFDVAEFNTILFVNSGTEVSTNDLYLRAAGGSRQATCLQAGI